MGENDEEEEEEEKEGKVENEGYRHEEFDVENADGGNDDDDAE